MAQKHIDDKEKVKDCLDKTQKSGTNSRDINLDVVRLIAYGFVITVHFYTGIAFYDQRIIGFGLFVLLTFRNIAMTCIPLFLILSGMLLKDHSLNKQHYIGLVRILVVYFITSVIALLYKHFILGTDFPLRKLVGSFTNFYANDYSNHVLLYINLYLLVPFINLAYKALSGKKKSSFL